MPPKRKALAETDGNNVITAPPAKKTAKADATTKAVKPRVRSKFKYSNEAGDPPAKFVRIIWGTRSSDDSEDDGKSTDGDSDGSDNENDKGPSGADKQKDVAPKPGKDALTDDMFRNAYDKGYLISEDGFEKLRWMMEEQQKRDPDSHDMYIYNDFSGYGMTEVMENLLADFNKILFKKDVSPFKKWAFVEGLVTFIKVGDLMAWMMNDDSEAVTEILNMIGTMLLTSFAMLAEHSLLGPASSSPIPNVAILSLLMLEFLGSGDGGDFGDSVLWPSEVVRALDKAGVDLDSILVDRVKVTKKQIFELRISYEMKQEDGVYKEHKAIKAWTVEDDFEDGERVWARWDWKKEYAVFKNAHYGGDEYNLDKWSKKDKEQYMFGNGEMSTMMGSDSD